MEVVLLENHVSHTCLGDPSDIGLYAEVFDHPRATAWSELKSKALIEGIMRERPHREVLEMRAHRSGWFKSSRSAQNGACLKARYRDGRPPAVLGKRDGIVE